MISQTYTISHLMTLYIKYIKDGILNQMRVV